MLLLFVSDNKKSVAYARAAVCCASEKAEFFFSIAFFFFFFFFFFCMAWRCRCCEETCFFELGSDWKAAVCVDVCIKRCIGAILLEKAVSHAFWRSFARRSDESFAFFFFLLIFFFFFFFVVGVSSHVRGAARTQPWDV